MTEFSRRFQTIHHETCMAAMQKPGRKTWTGPHSGKVLCDACGKSPANTGHHLIITRAKMVGCPDRLKLEIARHEMNLALVCFTCHHTDIEALRDSLIVQVSYKHYGEETVKQWVQEMEQKMGVTIPLPGRLCRWCVYARGNGCPYSECDGRALFKRMSVREMRNIGRLS